MHGGRVAWNLNIVLSLSFTVEYKYGCLFGHETYQLLSQTGYRMMIKRNYYFWIFQQSCFDLKSGDFHPKNGTVDLRGMYQHFHFHTHFSILLWEWSPWFIKYYWQWIHITRNIQGKERVGLDFSRTRKALLKLGSLLPLYCYGK